jgi:endonuclease/exonuclease/phosphatase family metal-dependent hydrolase
MLMSYRVLAGLLLALLCGCKSPPAASLRVMSYNIHHGEGMDGRVDLPRIADIIRKEQPDLVALQEVDRGVERSGREDQPAELGRLTGMRPIFEMNIPYQGGEYGNAVLTRLPVVYYRNHYLPQSLPNEQRGMLEVAVDARGRRVVFFATHFDYHTDDAERLASARMFQSLAAGHAERPVILAGDLNARPDSPVLTELLTFMQDSFMAGNGDGFTFPAGRPDRRIDYILFNRAAGLVRIGDRVLDEAMASDHRPIAAVFRLSNASGGGN